MPQQGTFCTPNWKSENVCYDFILIEADQFNNRVFEVTGGGKPYLITVYAVTGNMECSCPDKKYRGGSRGGYCKHELELATLL